MNVGVTKALVEAINELNSDRETPDHFMVYISTDYVFDGTSPPYKPLDEPNPLNEYGKSKLEGEQVMHHSEGAILRVPILYGDVEYLKESAVTGAYTVLFYRLAQSSFIVFVDVISLSVQKMNFHTFYLRCFTENDTTCKNLF